MASSTTPNYTYRDLNMLFAANPITGDVSCMVDSDAVKQSVVNLVYTQYYQRLFHPELGCNATAMLFDNADATTSFSLQKSISDVISNFEPRVTLQSVVVNLQSDQNAFAVTITFFINNVTTAVTVDFFLQRVR